jgi:hypothetical protein
MRKDDIKCVPSVEAEHIDHREENKNVLIEDKFRSQVPFAFVDIRVQNEHITSTS